MARIPTVVPASDLQQDAARVLSRVRKSDHPVFIADRGRAIAVLTSVESYEQTARELAILTRIARGDEEVRTNTGHDLDDVMDEADKLLSE